jgi:hypothetical protein
LDDGTTRARPNRTRNEAAVDTEAKFDKLMKTRADILGIEWLEVLVLGEIQSPVNVEDAVLHPDIDIVFLDAQRRACSERLDIGDTVHRRPPQGSSSRTRLR